MTRLLLIFTLGAWAYVEFFWMPSVNVQWEGVTSGWPVLVLTALATLSTVRLFWQQVLYHPSLQDPEVKLHGSLEETIDELREENWQLKQERNRYKDRWNNRQRASEEMLIKTARYDSVAQENVQLKEQLSEAHSEIQQLERRQRNLMATTENKLRKFKKRLQAEAEQKGSHG